MIRIYTLTVLASLLILFLISPWSAQQRAQVDLIIRGGTLLTMDPQRRIIEDGFLAVEGETITAVGTREALQSRYRAEKVIEAHGRAVLPGLINLHTHSFLILFRGLADDYTLDTWTEVLEPLHRDNDERPGFMKTGNYLACLEMIRRGTTTFVEMYHEPALLAEVAAEAGLRAVATLRLPFDRETGNVDSLEAERAFQEFYQGWKDHPLITPGIAAHAPHTVSTQMLRFSKSMADQYDVPLLIHLAEAASEVKQIDKQFGKSPTQYLDDLGFLSDRVLAVHAVKLTDQDIEILVQRGVSIAHCPESNAKLAVGIARVSDLLRAGLSVGLGTDSGVSNNNLDLFEEMDTAVKLQRAIQGRWEALTARQALEMATIRAAAAIGMQERIGSLEVGKRADIILVNVERTDLLPVYDYYSHLVYVTKGMDVETSIVNGRTIMERGRVLTLDAAQIGRMARKHAQQVRESMKAWKRATP